MVQPGRVFERGLRMDFMSRIYGVGVIGVNPPASWSIVAHLPAMRARPDKFHIAGIANSSAESARIEASWVFRRLLDVRRSRMTTRRSKFSPEARERAMRMVGEHL